MLPNSIQEHSLKQSCDHKFCQDFFLDSFGCALTSKVPHALLTGKEN